MLTLRVFEVLLLTVITVLLFRAQGEKIKPTFIQTFDHHLFSRAQVFMCVIFSEAGIICWKHSELQIQTEVN